MTDPIADQGADLERRLSRLEQIVARVASAEPEEEQDRIARAFNAFTQRMRARESQGG